MSDPYAEYEARMADRFGLEPVAYPPGLIPPRWVARARGNISRAEENYWHRRWSEQTSAGAGRIWDHVWTWQRDGHRYVTSEPYNLREDVRAHATDAIQEALAVDLAGYPGIVADGYTDNVWNPWTVLIVVRHVESPPIAPGAVFTVDETAKWVVAS